jgi:Lon protease-like protein
MERMPPIEPPIEPPMEQVGKSEEQSLPEVLPVFPLTGSLLLPGNWMPLNVFEPRYRNMVADAMEGSRHVGMIQPFVPHQDNWPALEEPPENPRLYGVGCAGRIERCEPQADGRYVILLRGVSRFRVRDELPLQRGYRRVAAEYGEFAPDLGEAAANLDPAALLPALERFSRAHQLTFDFDVLGALPGISLLNGLAVALPFRPEEKQALLEAPSTAEREALLLALMEMGIEPGSSEGHYAPPTLH